MLVEEDRAAYQYGERQGHDHQQAQRPVEQSGAEPTPVDTVLRDVALGALALLGAPLPLPRRLTPQLGQPLGKPIHP